MRYRWLKIVLGSIIFGLLMGFRNELPWFWLRALVAGVAFGFFAGMISSQMQHAKQKANTAS